MLTGRNRVVCLLIMPSVAQLTAQMSVFGQSYFTIVSMQVRWLFSWRVRAPTAGAICGGWVNRAREVRATGGREVVGREGQIGAR